jgi:hypothetical protein
MERDDLRKVLAKYDRRYGKEELQSCWAMLTGEQAERLRKRYPGLPLAEAVRRAVDYGLREEPESSPATKVRVQLRPDQAEELARRWPGEPQRRLIGRMVERHLQE